MLTKIYSVFIFFSPENAGVQLNSSGDLTYFYKQEEVSSYINHPFSYQMFSWYMYVNSHYVNPLTIE